MIGIQGLNGQAGRPGLVGALPCHGDHGAVEPNGPFRRRTVGTVPRRHVEAIALLAYSREAVEVGLFGVGKGSNGRKAWWVSPRFVVTG